MFYSSFFSHPEGILDAVLTYKNYFVKSASNSEHIQPWYYYLKIISYNNFNNVIISEAVILILGMIGIIFSSKNISNVSENLFFKLVAIFTLISAIAFSAIPYKTPWNMFSWWTGVIFLSGFGFSSLYRSLNKGLIKFGLILLVFLSSLHLIFQVYLTSYKFPSFPENPFTYSQPTSEIYSLTNEVNKIILYKKDILINVVAEDNQYWPLPWYFRKAKNVAWNNSPNSDIYKFDLIVAQPKFIDEITDILYTVPPPGERNLYVPFSGKDIQIRPGHFLTCYIKNDLFQEFISYRNNN